MWLLIVGHFAGFMVLLNNYNPYGDRIACCVLPFWSCWVNREIVVETNTCSRKGESVFGAGDGSANLLK
jgi:hypothetical protein